MCTVVFLLSIVIGGYSKKFSRRSFDKFISDRNFFFVSDILAVSCYIFCSVAANWDGIYDNETGILEWIDDPVSWLLILNIITSQDT